MTEARRRLILALCCVSVLLVGIDMTGVNVAIPTIATTFNSDISGLSWVLDAYTVTLAALLLFSSSTADRFGRKRVFLIGMAVFVAASAACAVAPTLGWLLGFRVLQAVGASALNPVAMAILGTVYTKPAERARALGVWGGVIGLSLALGPIVGGLLVDSPLGWRWIFLINVPIGVVALLITQRVVPESRSPRPRRFDVPGQIFVGAGLAALTFAIIEGAHLGWTTPIVIIAISVFGISAVGIAIVEPRRSEPLIELQLFKSVPFSAAAVMAVLSFAALSAFLFLASIYLQQLRGMTALDAGLLLLPLAIASMVFSPISGRILANRGARIPLLIAGTGIALAGGILAFVDTSTPIWVLLIAFTVMGLGNAAVGAPVTQSAVAGMPRERIAVATGISSTSRQIGATVGVAIAGAVLTIQTSTVSTQTIAWSLNAIYGLGVLVVGLIATSRWARRSLRRFAVDEMTEAVPQVDEASASAAS